MSRTMHDEQRMIEADERRRDKLVAAMQIKQFLRDTPDMASIAKALLFLIQCEIDRS